MEASSGAAARSSIESGGPGPDLIVCDYRLGEGADGLGVIGWIRRYLNGEITAVPVRADTDPGPQAPGYGCHLAQQPVRLA